MDWALLIGAAFVSSVLTATIGIGGGVLLISVMPGVVPVRAIVPIHGAVMLASNVSRGLLVMRSVDRRAVGLYATGAAVGVVFGARWVSSFPAERMPLVLGLFILVAIWAPVFIDRRRHRAIAEQLSTGHLPNPISYAVLGTVQAAASLFVGAAGPLAAPILLRSKFTRERLVATHAGLMTVMHGLKVISFGFLGFAFSDWTRPLVGMIVAVLFGSWVGTRLRARVPERRFHAVFRFGVSLLALRLVLGVGI